MVVDKVSFQLSVLVNFYLTHAQVVLSQLSGSNRAGFKIVPSNAKRSIQLDGIFNIISYDTVPKLQDTLMASEFKVIGAVTLSLS